MISDEHIKETYREEFACAFCKDSGKDPFDVMSSLSACCVCGGRGIVAIQMPCAPCAHCQGTGAIKTLICTVCRSKGEISFSESPIMICPEYNGSGEYASAFSMACLECSGSGWIAKQEGL